MGRILKNQTRCDSADPEFAQRVQMAFVTAEQAERAQVGGGTMTGSDAARLRMLARRGLLGGDSSADAARQRMIQRREKTSE